MKKTLMGLVVKADDEEVEYVEEITTDESPPDPLLLGEGEIGEDDEEEEEEEKRKRGVRIHHDATDATKDSEAARLPKPEALQGGPQTLQGLHIGRIPSSCAFCSRERNLCRIISGIFTRSPLPYGYSLVTPIPAGICNLSIVELKPSKNYFALRRPDGTYVLNGNWDIQAAGQYLIGGTTFTYTPSDDDSGEQLHAPGPLREPIELMLISQSPNPGIKYEYRVPLQDFLSSNPASRTPQTGGVLQNMGGLPGTLGRSPSSFPTGTLSVGSRNPILGIRNPTLGSGSTSIIPGIGSQPLVPGRTPFGPNNPNIVASGVGGLNPPVSSSGSVSRGRGIGSFDTAGVPVQRGTPQSGIGITPGGQQSRTPTFTGTQPRIPVTSSRGIGTRGSTGIAAVVPHMQPITPHGSSSLPLPWNPSYNPQDGSQLSVGSPYQPSQTLPRIPTSGSSSTGKLGQPSSGSTRPVIPGSGTTGVQAGLPSSDSAKLPGIPPEFPANSVPLRPIPIPRPATPGSRRPPLNIPGVIQRHHSGEHGKTHTETLPSGHRTRHKHGGKRRKGHRKGSRTSGEAPHDTPFGAGIQQTQPNIVSASPSSNSTIPTKGQKGRGSRRQQQNDSSATGRRRGGRGKGRGGGRGKQRSRYQWAEKGFTPCSKPCGGGNQTSILSCERRRKKTVVSDRRCSHLPRPQALTIMCNVKPCPAAWEPGEWGPCSVTCGMGVQMRPLVCKQKISPTFTTMVPEAACFSPATVATSQVCEMGRCPSSSPEWELGPWSNCSAPCGLGSRTREAKCILQGLQVADDSCDLESLADTEQVCDMGSCVTDTWFFSEWSNQCSESCGTGIQTRKVHCLVSSPGTGGECLAETRPEASRTCRGESGCGGQWFAGPWGDCSTACGVGRETRSVICVVVTRKGKWRVVEDDQCTPQARPRDSQECNVEPCAPEWYTTDWSECSASCEGGVMRREVTCLDATLRPSADCHNASKPATREPCNLHLCTTTSSSVMLYTTPGKTSADADEEEVSKGKDKEQPDYEGSEEIENELVVEEVSGSELNVIPDKDAQGDESVADDEDEEAERTREDEEADKKEKSKKSKKTTKKKGKSPAEAERKTDGSSASASALPNPERTSCIDRIKNCHLVFRARLCRLKYYNKLCCRTCSTS